MRVKKFKANTMQEAMKQVRQELGEEAVILNSKVNHITKLFGLISKKQFEVIAAIDEVVDVPIKHKSKLVNNEKINQPSELHLKNIDVQPQASLIKDVEEMKRTLKSIEKNQQNKQLWSDAMMELEGTLDSLEYPNSMIDEFMEQIIKEVDTNLRNDYKLLMQKFIQHTMNDYNNLSKPLSLSKKYICLVGPTGVGKTTTLAKLAAYASIQKDKKIGFITTDTYRIAAIDQLKTYANILDAPIEICYNSDDFQKAKEKLDNLDMIFIDTAGRNYLKDYYIQDLKQMIDFHNEMETYLVLSLTSKYSDMEKITNQFLKIPFDAYILTKQDETTSWGAMLALIRKYKKNVSFITQGQDVPEDITHVSTSVISSLLEEGLKK